MALADEISRRLQGGRVNRPVDDDDSAYVVEDIKNLKAAVHELQGAAVRIAQELDRIAERRGT